MSAPTAIPFAGGSVKIVSLSELDAYDAWPDVFANKWKDHRYYEIVDQTVRGFEHRYLFFQDRNGRNRGVQPIFFVRQNLTEGVPGKIASIVNRIRKIFPRFLTMRVLMVGCAAGAGELGASNPEDERWLAEALPTALLSYARQNGASLIVFKDFYAKYRSVLASLCAHGYTRIPSMPMTRLSLEYASFDDYLASIGYITRKSLRRKFRKADRAAKIDMQILTDIAPHLDEIYPLYLQVHERSPMKFEKLTKEYLAKLGQLMPERVRFFIWRLDRRIIAFSICMVHDGTIYDEYLGLDYSVALDLHLYFYTLRDILRWAINHRLTFYCSSPLNYDPKLHLGCDLAPLDLYVRHTQPLLNPIFSRVVKFLEPTRHDSVLPKFANAAELYG